MIGESLRAVLDQISEVRVSEKEADELKRILTDDRITTGLTVSFDDPILGRTFVNSYEDPFFRPKFYDDPISVVDALNGKEGMQFDPVIPGKDAPKDPRPR